jgi:hypothetical protein
MTTRSNITDELRELLHQIADQRQRAAEVQKQLLEQNVKHLHELQLDAERRARINLATIYELQRQHTVLRHQQLQLEQLHSRLQLQQQTLRNSFVERYGYQIVEDRDTIQLAPLNFDVRNRSRAAEIEKRIQDNTIQFVLSNTRKELPQDGADCSICIDSLRCGDEVRRLGCMHVFHSKCIDKWFLSSGIPSMIFSQVPLLACPLCKIDIATANEFDVQ